MKQKFVFYTGEGYTVSPKNIELDNYQILGFEEGINYDDAFSKLIMNNPWIDDSGFSKEEILCHIIVIDGVESSGM